MRRGRSVADVPARGPVRRMRAAVVTAAATATLLAGGTVTALGATTPPPPPATRPGDCATMAVGSTGPAVTALQRIVGTSADGGFGPATTTALRRWQSAHHLRTTGQVDAPTWRALPAAATVCGTPLHRLVPATGRPCPALRVGVSGPAVAALQQRLKVKALGYFGPLTAVAVAAVQTAARIAPPGPVGPRTWAATHLVGTPACPSTTGVDAFVVSRPTATPTATPRPTAGAAASPTPKPTATVDPVLAAKRAAVRAQAVAALAALATSSTTSTDVTAATAARSALGVLGTPYVWGGASPKGFDCSGLVSWAYARAGLQLARVAADQYAGGPRLPLAQARRGDLLFWALDVLDPTTIYHVGIYLGAGQMVEAPQTGLTVRVRAVSGSTLLPTVVRPSALLKLPVTAGATGWTVKQVQRALVAAGLAVTVDGGFGSQTTLAVKAMQQRANLPVTGAVDAATWAALTGDHT